MMATFAQIRVSAQDKTTYLFQKGNKRSLVGSWDLQVTIRDGQTGDPIPFFPTFPVMRTYNQGGTMQDAGGDSSENPQTTLIGKKAGKKVRPGDKLQVRNPSGTISEEFVFTGL